MCLNVLQKFFPPFRDFSLTQHKLKAQVSLTFVQTQSIFDFSWQKEVNSVLFSFAATASALYQSGVKIIGMFCFCLNAASEAEPHFVVWDPETQTVKKSPNLSQGLSPAPPALFTGTLENSNAGFSKMFSGGVVDFLGVFGFKVYTTFKQAHS